MLHSLVYNSRKYISFCCSDLIGLALLFKPLIINDIGLLTQNKLEFQRFIYFIDYGLGREQLKTNEIKRTHRVCSESFFFAEIYPLKLDLDLIMDFVAMDNAIVFIADFDQVMQYIEKSENCSLFLKLIFEVE